MMGCQTWNSFFYIAASLPAFVLEIVFLTAWPISSLSSVSHQVDVCNLDLDVGIGDCSHLIADFFREGLPERFQSSSGLTALSLVDEQVSGFGAAHRRYLGPHWFWVGAALSNLPLRPPWWGRRWIHGFHGLCGAGAGVVGAAADTSVPPCWFRLSWFCGPRSKRAT